MAVNISSGKKNQVAPCAALRIARNYPVN